MKCRAFVLPSLVFSLVVACGGSDEEAEAEAATNHCADICNFWAECNSGEIDPSACDEHCAEVVSDVSDDCLELYGAQTECEADNLDCSDLLGEACAAESQAYRECESVAGE